MKVSVIIPTYNEESVILECLISLSKQTYKDIEIIVVDDGSTDKTLHVLSKFQISYFKFQILRQAHQGSGAARNLGAKHAKGEILVFVDSDMTLEPDFIEKLVEPILRGGARGTFSKEEYVVNKDNVWSKCWGINEGWKEGRRHSSRELVESDTQKVFRAILKKEFEKVGGFSENVGYTDDWTLSEKLGYEATVAPGAKFYHKNPQNLEEIFEQARWAGKRKYKLGKIGALFTLARASFPVSAIVGLAKGVWFRKPEFLIFKLVYDLGIFVGLVELLVIGKTSK